ncbi:TPA: leucine-rich repeat protein [Photobacterium damselae]
MKKPHTLTINDVVFDVENGSIEKYLGDYKDIIIPSDFNGIEVNVIGHNSFLDGKLSSVIIPNSVTSIGDLAFAENKLNEVTIPNSVTSIGISAFTYKKTQTILNIQRHLLFISICLSICFIQIFLLLLA